MKVAVCKVAVAAMRKEADERSEMVSQMLFGEVADIIETVGNWSLLMLETDGYFGWVNHIALDMDISAEFSELLYDRYLVKSHQMLCVNVASGQKNLLPSGSILHNYLPSTRTFYNSDSEWQVKDGEIVPFDYQMKPEEMCEYAQTYVNTPYLWGGRTCFGMDCSGFVQLSIRMAGIQLPRDAVQQLEGHADISFSMLAKAGDLAFFENSEGNIVHVGLLLSPTKIIHASGFVRIDRFDQQGIFNSSTNNYTHKLRLIKRVFV